MTCVVYARVSTEKQADKELSIPAQLHAMRDYAQRQGWSVLEEYTEPGASGRSAERPVLRQMLARCKCEPKVDVVLVHKVDRLARNVYDHATIKALLKEKSIRLASVVENMDDSITGQLVENIMASIADFYSANLGEEVKKGMTAKIRRGEWPHQPPFGYRLTRSEHGRSVAEEDAVAGPLIREAFQLYASGYYSLRHVASELATKGLLTKLGKPFRTGQLHFLFRNHFYTGRLMWKGELHQGVHVPIIDLPLFERVQELLTDHGRRGATRYGRQQFLLRGLAYCGGCHTKMTAERHKGHAYYRCLANARSRRECGAPFSNGARVEEALERVYQALLLSDGAKRRIVSVVVRRLQRPASAEAVHRLASVTMARTRLLEREIKTAEAYTAGELTQNVFLSLTRRLEAERSGMDAELRRLSADPDKIASTARDRIEPARSVWDLHVAMAQEERVRLAHAAFERLEVLSGKMTDVRFRPCFLELVEETPASIEHGITPTLEGEACALALAGMVTPPVDSSLVVESRPSLP